MKAVRLLKVGDLQIQDVPVPEIEDEEVLVQVKVATICHTDVLIRSGDFPANTPVTLGHEGAGVVAKMGSKVEGLVEGDRVAIGPIVGCGRCKLCMLGKEGFCENGYEFMGGGFDGTFAEYIKMPERSLFRLPDVIPFDQGSALVDALVTPYGAMRTGEVEPGDSVAIFGLGGLGQCAVQCAKVFGAAKIIAIDTVDKKLMLAKQVGADETINPTKVDPVERIKELTNGLGVDAAFEIVGTKETADQAIAALRRLGRAVIVGIGIPKIEIEAPDMFLSLGLSVRGHLGCDPTDFHPVIDLVAAGKIDLSHLVTHRVSFPDGVNKGIDILEEGEGNPVRIAIMME